MADRIQQRRDTRARWEEFNPLLLEGEVGYVTDDPNLYKIGDGINRWNSLPYRGFDGTITQETGNSENAVMSQKAVSEKLSELGSKVNKYGFEQGALTSEEGLPFDSKKRVRSFFIDCDLIHSVSIAENYKCWVWIYHKNGEFVARYEAINQSISYDMIHKFDCFIRLTIGRIDNEFISIEEVVTALSIRLATGLKSDIERVQSDINSVNVLYDNRFVYDSFKESVNTERITSRYITDGGLIRSAVDTFSLEYYQAAEDCVVKVNCTTASSSLKTGAIVIVNSLDELEIDNRVTRIINVGVNKGESVEAKVQLNKDEIVVMSNYSNNKYSFLKAIKENILDDVGKLKYRKLTALGSSGLALSSGGQYMLSESQKKYYGVSSDLTMTRVLQKLLGYDLANVCAIGGNTASNTMFMVGLTAYVLRNGFILKADKSETDYNWSTSTIGTLMTENLKNLGNAALLSSFEGMINGIEVSVNPYSGKIRAIKDLRNDVVIPPESLLVRKPQTTSESNGVVMTSIQDSEGLILQLGANDEGNSPEELVNYFDLAIQTSGCKWFVCMGKNGNGSVNDVSELNKAISLLKKKYGSRFIDHRSYMRSPNALADQGITPTTSDEYPDENGNNSNPLTANQISHNVKCDMQCLAEGVYPSSFWHSAYRDNEPNNQRINDTHFNAQGLECWGKYMAKMISTIIQPPLSRNL